MPSATPIRETSKARLTDLLTFTWANYEMTTVNNRTLMKYFLADLFGTFVGLQRGPNDIGPQHCPRLHFCQVRLGSTDVDSMIYLRQLRHDSDSRWPVLEGYLVTFDRKNIRVLNPDIQANMHAFALNEENLSVWKQYMVVCAERCRTCHHRRDCEDDESSTGQRTVPLSTSFRESPVCSCGEGKGIDKAA